MATSIRTQRDEHVEVIWSRDQAAANRRTAELAPASQRFGEALFMRGSPAPLAQEALQLSHQTNLESWPEALTDVDRVGRMVIGPAREVVWASTSALKLLKPGAPLALRFGRLIGSGRSNEDRLESLVKHALSTGARAEGLFASAEGEEATIFVRVKSCVNSSRLAVQVRDLSTHVQNLPDFVSLYGLTRTQHQVLSLLLNGLSVTEIAERLDNSVLTVRTHVKRAYSTLGISSKEQLFSIVLKLMAT